MEVLDEGNGELLAWCDPDEHREWVRKNKSLSMESKVMDLSEAISKFVHDGCYLAMGGFGHIRVSMAAIYEIIRQRKRDLVFAGKTAVHDIDVLIAAGCVSKVEVAYCFGHELRGLSPASRRAVESGKVKIAAEWSNAAFQWRFKAAASGLPWIPARILMGTDTFRRSAAKIVKDPFTGKPICLIPACFPDVAIIHVHECDEYGNCRINGSLIMDFELARAAKRLIITTEKIIPNEKIREEPWRTCIPYFYVDAVVEVPYGCHPCNMPGCYYFDEEHMAEYLRSTLTEEGTKQYFDKYVYGVKDFNEYLELVGGVKKLKYLEALERGRARFTYPWISS
ncbi:MAG: CoA transferase subunit A [Candidatus Verstraetearchaeota archaeon]|jgi:3-oxoacid CoA-transferase subunit A/glutaconate CoA-transferase subunit A|nr:CoA transferase subunit A [Candidatus Verstraetearchaeota archaeon]